MFQTPIPGSPQNTGSFMAPAGGGGPAVAGAMNNPGMPVTTQQGNSAPVPMPQAPTMAPQPLGGPQQPIPQLNPEQVRQQQKQMILKGLLDALATHNQIDQARAGVHSFQKPRPLGPGPLS